MAFKCPHAVMLTKSKYVYLAILVYTLLHLSQQQQGDMHVSTEYVALTPITPINEHKLNFSPSRAWCAPTQTVSWALAYIAHMKNCH